MNSGRQAAREAGNMVVEFNVELDGRFPVGH
jgi:hypothetical protein